MHSKIEHLSQKEQQLILDSPLLVTVLIAGADGNFDEAEIKTAIKIIHTKSYAEEKDVRGIFKDIDSHSESAIDSLIYSMPTDLTSRTVSITRKLEELNEIMPKLEVQFAKDLYKSLRELAYYIGHSHDSILGIGFNLKVKKDLLHLDMIQEPFHNH
ncbi:MAG: hypothetical protein H7321_00035 [Bacteroidia bacterium]|nr:hypothetical protein [Bacteroidia bacterium]